MSRLSLDEASPTRVAETQPPHAVRGAMSIRLAALGGMVFFALPVTFASLTNNFPTATHSRHEFFSYLADHQGRLQVAAVLLPCRRHCYPCPDSSALLEG
jgi:hypothetical protein